MKCPKCSATIAQSNINIQTDIAQCQACEHIFKVSEQLEDEIDDGFEINSPPEGAWMRNERDQIVVGATTRSFIAFFLVPFMLVWTGGSVGGIYGAQVASGEFDITLSLFGIPFILGSVVFWSAALMAIWGKVELTLTKQGGKIFTGIGAIGFTKKFDWSEVSTVQEKVVTSKKSQYTSISLEGKKRISFGKGLSDNRRYYIFRTVKSILAKRK